jgi:hypothetical protein
MGKLERLAAQGEDVRAALDEHALADVAALAHLLIRDHSRRAGAILPAHAMRTYAERSESEREGMRAAVEHVIVALVLLKYIDPPG